MATATSSCSDHSLDARRLLAIAWALLGALVAVDFVRVLARFSWQYTDFDQALQWAAAHELLAGRLHEPRFFGQAYNSMVEGWSAAPLVALGLPYAVAVPLVTAVLALAPFVALSACARALGRPLAALAVMALPLALPLPFAMLASMPRGFVPGISLAGLAAVATCSPQPSGRTFAAVLALVLAVSLNPNAAVVAGPVALYLLLRRGRSHQFLVAAGTAVAAGALLHWLSVVFYALHPEYVVYGTKLPGLLDFGAARMLAAWADADRWLGMVSPALPGGVLWLALLVAALLALLVVRALRADAGSATESALAGRDAAAAWTLAAGAALVLVTLGLERTHVGSDSLFWPLSRAYLGVPALLAFVAVCADRSSLDGRRLRPMVLAVVVLATGCFVLRGRQLDATVEHELGITNPVGVRPWAVQELASRCQALDELALRHDADLVLVGEFEIALTYACEPLIDGDWGMLLVRTVDRRTWRLLEELEHGPRTALLYGFSAQELANLRQEGAALGPPDAVGGVAVVPIDLPGGMAAFTLLAESGMQGADWLVDRARRLENARR